MNDHIKPLVDTGLFEDVSYNFHGQDLIIELSPSRDVYPIHLVNLPIAGGKELDDRLRAIFPLYHGKVPSIGGLLDGVRQELEEELRAKGIQATIGSTAYVDPKLDKITSIRLSITNPPVLVGEIEVSGASSALADKVRVLAAKAIGTEYRTDDALSGIETSLGNFYREQGYLEAAVHATAKPAAVDNDGVHVPFSVTIDEGLQYKLTGFKLTPGLLVTQEAFDRQSGIHPGEVVSLAAVRENWTYITKQYHKQGFMKARILPTATIDHAKGTIGYTVAVEPGPVYTMGVVRVPNGDDELRSAILGEWKMPAGAVFNEGAILALTSAPSLARLFEVAELRYSLTLHDDSRTVDVDIRLERKLP